MDKSTSFGIVDSKVSGVPIINLDNNKVIGIHKQSSDKYNKGTFLNLPLTNYIEKIIQIKLQL